MAYLKLTCEIKDKQEIEKHYDLRYGAPGMPREKKKKKTPEEMAAQNRWRKCRELRRIIELNFGEGDWHVTLTCSKENRPEREEAPKVIRTFRDKLRKAYKKNGWELKYIITCETGERGAVHWHMIVNDMHSEKESTAKLIRRLWDRGRPYFSALDDSGDYKKLAEYIGFDLSRGVIKRSEHPFTTGLSADDVRFTNHYYEDKLESALFSTIHEGGHGMYEQGVSLVAVGDVTGLEDLFGVIPAAEETTILKLISNETEERIFPDLAEFLYRPVSANVLLWAEGLDKKRYPVVICGEHTCLINASVDELGHRSYGNHPIFVAANISKVLRSVLCNTLRHISAPIASSDYAGITLLEDVHGDTLLLVIDYSDYDLASENRTWESDIRFHTDEFTDLEPLYGKNPICLKSDDTLHGISLQLHQQECALFKLIRK